MAEIEAMALALIGVKNFGLSIFLFIQWHEIQELLCFGQRRPLRGLFFLLY